MDTRMFVNEWYSYLGKLPDLLLALLVLLVGWLIAKLIEKAVYGILKKANIDNKLYVGENKSGRKWTTEKIVSKVVYFIALVFVFIMFFNILQLSFIATPLVSMLSTITAFIPNILKAALILLLAWVIASILKVVIEKLGTSGPFKSALLKSKLFQEERVVRQAVHTFSKIVFYLVLLVFLPGVLGALNITGVSGPFSDMIQSMLAFIPKLFASALILLVGWFVAKIVRDILTGFLSTLGIERIGAKLGLTRVLQNTSIASVIGNIVYVLILIPVVISALEQLNLRGISEPAIAMLNDIMTMLPNIAIAIVLVLVGIYVGKWIGNVVSGLLNGVGFNSLLNKMGIGNWNPAATSNNIDPANPSPNSNTSLSDLVGNIVQILIIVLFTVEALEIVELTFLVTLATGVLAYLPNVIAAIVIVGVGLVLGNLSKRVISSILGQSNLKFLSTLTKYAIIALSFFMALDQLMIADSIVNAAFTLILGGLALAFGLAFGLGGKDFASKYLAKLDKNIEREVPKKNNPNTDININNNNFPPSN